MIAPHPTYSHPTPAPGSPEALAQGCRCPVMDNRRGRGVEGRWWIAGDCPLHAPAKEREV